MSRILVVGLPDITGFQVCRELRTFSEVPVIFLTAREVAALHGGDIRLRNRDQGGAIAELSLPGR